MRVKTCAATVVRLLTALLLCVLWVVALPPAASAHELGTTRVSATFAPDHSYVIDVVTDAQSLVEKLESAADVPADAITPADADARRLEARLRELQDTLWSRLALSFDGDSVRDGLSVDVAPPADAASPALAHVKLTGRHAAGATHMTWQYGWTFASYALAIRTPADDQPRVQWLEGGDTSAPQPLGGPSRPVDSWTRTAGRYLWLGFTHIVPLGLDHVLFVIGLFLLNSRIRPLLIQVSAFTAAHSITLALSMLGLVAVPSHIVEPMIAVSIAYVAIENLFLSEVKTWRVALVFACGLLHGLGFAGVLSELGLPRGQFVTALLSFNAGVEAAQLSVIAAAFVLLGTEARQRGWYRERIVIPASALIACVAVYWTVARLVP